MQSTETYESLDDAFARVASAGDVILAFAPDADDALFSLFHQFAVAPETREIVETVLAGLARAVLKSAAHRDLEANPLDARAAAALWRSGDEGLAVLFALGAAGRLGLPCAIDRCGPRLLLAEWTLQRLAEMAAEPVAGVTVH